MSTPIVPIATYARVSSDEQRDRHTVLNQRAALDRRLSSEPGVVVFKHYEDDGVSGTIPLQERPDGCALVRDARAGHFSQIWFVPRRSPRSRLLRTSPHPETLRGPRHLVPRHR